MTTSEDTIKLYYNTEREKLEMPEYGRYILQMVEHLKTIEDKQKRSEQAAAVVRSMEILNPQVRQLDDYSHKLWDHLYMIAGLDLDIESPFPAPLAEELKSEPLRIARPEKPVKAAHYGRNIENIIELITTQEEGDVKTAMIRSLAIYMRQQYLIWNKDTVSDETIFADIVKLSDGRISIPEGLSLSRISETASFSRPGIMAPNGGNANFRPQGNRNRKNKRRSGKSQH